MASYRLTVRVDPIWVKHFRDHKINLCSAFGVQADLSRSTYNIIATVEG